MCVTHGESTPFRLWVLFYCVTLFLFAHSPTGSFWTCFLFLVIKSQTLRASLCESVCEHMFSFLLVSVQKRNYWIMGYMFAWAIRIHLIRFPHVQAVSCPHRPCVGLSGALTPLLTILPPLWTVSSRQVCCVPQCGFLPPAPHSVWFSTWTLLSTVFGNYFDHTKRSPSTSNLPKASIIHFSIECYQILLGIQIPPDTRFSGDMPRTSVKELGRWFSLQRAVSTRSWVPSSEPTF